MAGIDLGGVASWIIAALMGLGILWATNKGMLKTQYSFGEASIPMENVGTLIFLVAIGLGCFYFLIDVVRKI